MAPSPFLSNIDDKEATATISIHSYMGINGTNIWRKNALFLTWMSQMQFRQRRKKWKCILFTPYSITKRIKRAYSSRPRNDVVKKGGCTVFEERGLQAGESRLIQPYLWRPVVSMAQSTFISLNWCISYSLLPDSRLTIVQAMLTFCVDYCNALCVCHCLLHTQLN